MPAVHSIGSVFAHRFAYPSRDFPFTDRGNTQEVSWPFRMGHSLVFRYPFSRHGFVVGRWGAPMDEDDAMLRALNGELIGYTPPTEPEDNNGFFKKTVQCESCGGATPRSETWTTGFDRLCASCYDRSQQGTPDA